MGGSWPDLIAACMSLLAAAAFAAAAMFVLEMPSSERTLLCQSGRTRLIRDAFCLQSMTSLFISSFSAWSTQMS